MEMYIVTFVLNEGTRGIETLAYLFVQNLTQLNYMTDITWESRVDGRR